MQQKVFDIDHVYCSTDLSSVVGEFGLATITAFEGSGNNVFIGLSNGEIVSYSINERIQDGQLHCDADEWCRGFIPSGKPIARLCSASAVNTLLVLADGLLYLLRLQSLETVTKFKIKSISCFDINQNPFVDNPFVIQLAIATSKKNILLAEIERDELSVKKEIPSFDPVLEIVINCKAFDGYCLCYATEVCYFLDNLQFPSEKRRQELFPFNVDEMKPLIRRIAKEEFLLNGPNNLGMFVSGQGMSPRPPLHWGEQSAQSITYCRPFAIALCHEYICVYSTEDQKIRQQLSFSNGVMLGNFDGQLFVASSRAFYKLSEIAIDKQIESLFANGKITEALEYAQTTRFKFSEDEFNLRFEQWQQRAAFIEFADQHFERAFQLFIDSHADVREIISLYPDLMPRSSFVRSVFETADVLSVCKGSASALEEAYGYLTEYLETVRMEEWASAFGKELDTALLKLYTKSNNSEKFNNLLSSEPHNPFTYDTQDSIQFLERFQYFYFLGLFFVNSGRLLDALKLWKKLVDGVVEDSNFPGVGTITDALKKCCDVDILKEFFTWLLVDNEIQVIEVINNHIQPEILKDECFLDLVQLHPVVLRAYLWQTIVKLGVEEESMHTKLALMYCDDAIAELKRDTLDQPKLDQSRQLLQDMLRQSNFYRIHLVQAKLGDGGDSLLKEQAILHGKLGEDETALDLLINRCQDFESALEYCRSQSKDKDRMFKQQLNHLFLRVLYESVQKSHNDGQFVHVLKLLSQEELEVDMNYVLKLFPEYWSFAVVSDFIKKSSVSLQSYANVCKFQKYLSKSVLIKKQNDKLKLTSKPVKLTDSSRCAICDKCFIEVDCFVYPNGTLVHRSCVRHKYLCPVTGEVFSIQ